MASSFIRLYRYAKAVGAEAKENFTTEALRAAVKTDSRPLLDALRNVGVADVEPNAVVEVDTQVSIRGVGQIDLVVRATSATRRTSVWFEVKVDASESGQQLANYNQFIAQCAADERPILVVLGRHPLDASTNFLSWQQLRRAIVDSATASPYWQDFKLYLEELRMADSYDEPVTEREAQSLDSARKLFGKVARVLTPFASAATAIWPGSVWPKEEPKVIDAMTSTFIRLGTLGITYVGQNRAGVSAGAYVDPATNDVWLGVWIWCRPNYVRERQAILAATQTRTWGEEWYREDAEWELFGAYHRLHSFPSHAAATAWLAHHLTEMKAAGLLDLLPQLGTAGL